MVDRGRNDGVDPDEWVAREYPGSARSCLIAEKETP